MTITFESAADLERALKRAAAQHGAYGEETGVPDADWPIWYSKFMESEQAASSD